MGAAASTDGGATVQQVRSSVLNGKPLDASDIKVCNTIEGIHPHLFSFSSQKV